MQHHANTKIAARLVMRSLGYRTLEVGLQAQICVRVATGARSCSPFDFAPLRARHGQARWRAGDAPRDLGTRPPGSNSGTIRERSFEVQIRFSWIASCHGTGRRTGRTTSSTAQRNGSQTVDSPPHPTRVQAEMCTSS